MSPHNREVWKMRILVYGNDFEQALVITGFLMSLLTEVIWLSLQHITNPGDALLVLGAGVFLSLFVPAMLSVLRFRYVKKVAKEYFDDDVMEKVPGYSLEVKAQFVAKIILGVLHEDPENLPLHIAAYTPSEEKSYTYEEIKKHIANAARLWRLSYGV